MVKKFVLVFSCLFIIAGCVSPIGLKMDVVLWDCGAATAETKTANCTATTDYLAGFTYSGPVKPINYGAAVPHGRGGKISDFSNAEILDFLFNYGKLTW